jgi:acetoin utilization protein AcuB
MFVCERMSHPVITIHADMPVQDALKLMHTEHIRRLPVVDAKGGLIGIVAEHDLQNASPSEATTLSVWEISYLLSKITVDRVMLHKVITVGEDTPIEEAARIMADNKVSSLPVMRGNELVGIITETDLFKVFLELLGAREKGVRLTVLLEERPGKLNELTESIQKLGGNIIALGTFAGESSANRMVTVKVSGVDMDALKQGVASVVEKVVDIRITGVA